MYLFNPEETGVFKYIHPLKKDKVKKLLESAIPDYVDKIILFGSSLKLYCRPFSDVDLYFISEKDHDDIVDEIYTLCKNIGSKFDLLINDNESFSEGSIELNSVESEIQKEGLILYEKETRKPV